MAQILVFLGAVIALSQQLAENLFGAYLKGAWMRVAGILVTTALTGLAWLVGREMADAPQVLLDLGAYPFTFILVLGLAAGLLSGVWHSVLETFFPGANGGRLLNGKE